MRSAYLVLGVPGDASPEEIEAAFHRAERLFPRERLAQEEGAIGRLNELRTAYQLLRDPASRAAHDRKLQQGVRPPAPRRTVVAVEEEASPMRKVMVAGLLLVAAVFAAGLFVSYRNAEARRVVAEQEIAAQKAAAEKAKRSLEQEERAAALKARAAAQAEANERRMVYEAQASSARAQVNMRMAEAASVQAQRAEQADAQRRESTRLAEERRAAMEARQRTERDKQRVREICYQLYRRPDC